MTSRIGVKGKNHEVPFPNLPTDQGTSVQMPGIGGRGALRWGLIVCLYVLAAASSVFGQQFSPPRNISENGNSMIPVVAADQRGDGHVYVVHSPKPLEWGGANMGLWFMGSDQAGNTFSSPTQIYQAGFEPSMTVDSSGSIWITWSQQTKIGVMRSTDGGANFTEVASPAPDTPSAIRRNPDIAVDSQGIATVAWQEVVGQGNADIFVSRYDNIEQAWSLPINVSNDQAYSAEPRVAIGTNGSIHIVWGDTNSGWVRHVRSLDGSTFGPVQQIIPTTRRPRIAINKAGLIAVVSEGTYFRCSTDNGTTFTPVQQISGLGIQHPDVAVEADGTIDVVAQDYGTSGFPTALRFASSGDGGATFKILHFADTQGDVQVGQGIMETGLPRIAIGSGIHIVWYDYKVYQTDNGPVNGFDTFYTDGPVPTPVLTFLGSEPLSAGCTVGSSCTRYHLSVSNWQLFPKPLFAPFYEIRRTTGYIYATTEPLSLLATFGDLTSPYSLTQIYFDIPTGESPPVEIQLALVDYANLISVNLQQYVTYWSNPLPIGANPASSGYAPISLPLLHGGGTNTYKFPNDQLNTFNYKVQYPSFADSEPSYNQDLAKLIVQPILISQGDLDSLVAGSSFAGVSLVRYAGTPGNSGILFRTTCEDAAHNPVTCPAPGSYSVYTSWDSAAGQTITAPAFLKAPEGTNEWVDILTDFYESRTDPTGRGGTCCRLSDFVMVDRGTSATAGTPLPTINITSPVDGATYLLGEVFNAKYSCTPSSGTALETCVGTTSSGKPISTSPIGLKSFQVTATVHPNTNTNKHVSYTRLVNYQVVGVLSDKICLLYDPLRSVKSGATYPIKLQVCDEFGVNQSSLSTVVHATGLRKVDSTPDGAILATSGNANPDNDFRYDATLGGVGGGYIFNLSTKGLSGGTYSLEFKVTRTTGTPTMHTVQFNVKN